LGDTLLRDAHNARAKSLYFALELEARFRQALFHNALRSFAGAKNLANFFLAFAT
jgi:hypothetical protein